MENGNGGYEETVLRDMDQMLECLNFYRTRLSGSLNMDEKKRLVGRIYSYRSRHYPLTDDNPVSEFLELVKYWERGTLTGLELVILEDKLSNDVYGEAGEGKA